MVEPQDSKFMARAIQLAKRGCNTTDPNPRVGCILTKNGQAIAEGWHLWAGQKHAEVDALSKTNDARGSTAYVTLEPCSHHGKTPPCCDALIRAGVTRVVIAMKDPNPAVAGTGMSRLQEAGLEVECGVLEADANALNSGFIKRMEKGLPFVTSKMAMSLDGRTAMSTGESQWITSSVARNDVHRMRASSSAIMTGINTVLADDPGLNVRLSEAVQVLPPVRIVLDSNLKMPTTAKMLKIPGDCYILTCTNDKVKQQQLEQAGFHVFQMPAGDDDRLNLHKVMRFLGRMGFNNILIEAGSVLNGALLTEDLVDEWVVYMAAIILGDEGRGLFSMPGLTRMKDKKQMMLKEIRKIGPDLRLKLVPGK